MIIHNNFTSPLFGTWVVKGEMSCGCIRAGFGAEFRNFYARPCPCSLRFKILVQN